RRLASEREPRLWPSLRRGFCRMRRRFLQDRPHAVQSGPRRGDGAGDRAMFPPRAHRRGAARALLRPAVTRVIIFVDEPDWHCRRLLAAFERRQSTASVVSLRRCGFQLGNEGAGVAIPGFETGLPDAVLVRNIPTGSFEQITFRLSILHALRELGV